MISFFIFVALILLIDYYLFQAVITVRKDWSRMTQRIVRIGFWIPTILSIAALIWWNFANPDSMGPQVRNWVRVAVMGIYLSKFFGILVMFIDDLQRGVRWVAGLFSAGTEPSTGNVIPRSEFLAKTALIATAVPFTALAFGIISGAHDYRVRRKTVYLPNLPKSFDGMKIGQLSDIHSGSFFNKTAVWLCAYLMIEKWFMR